MTDPIVEEVRKHREEIAARFGHDLKKIVAYIRRREKESGHNIVDLSRKRARV